MPTKDKAGVPKVIGRGQKVIGEAIFEKIKAKNEKIQAFLRKIRAQSAADGVLK